MSTPEPQVCGLCGITRIGDHCQTHYGLLRNKAPLTREVFYVRCCSKAIKQGKTGCINADAKPTPEDYKHDFGLLDNSVQPLDMNLISDSLGEAVTPISQNSPLSLELTLEDQFTLQSQKTQLLKLTLTEFRELVPSLLQQLLIYRRVVQQLFAKTI